MGEREIERRREGREVGRREGRTGTRPNSPPDSEPSVAGSLGDCDTESYKGEERRSCKERKRETATHTSPPPTQRTVTPNSIIEAFMS